MIMGRSMGNLVFSQNGGRASNSRFYWYPLTLSFTGSEALLPLELHQQLPIRTYTNRDTILARQARRFWRSMVTTTIRNCHRWKAGAYRRTMPHHDASHPRTLGKVTRSRTRTLRRQTPEPNFTNYDVFLGFPVALPTPRLQEHAVFAVNGDEVTVSGFKRSFSSSCLAWPDVWIPKWFITTGLFESWLMMRLRIFRYLGSAWQR